MLFIRSIYSLIGQDPEVADYAATYVHIVLPSLYFFVISQSYAMFAGNQRVTWISTTGTISGVCVHFVCTMILYEMAELGFVAVPISTAIHFLVRFGVNFYFAEFGSQFKKFDDVKLFSEQTYTGYKSQLHMCLNSLAMGVWGWWAFDIFTLIASYMDTAVIAAQTILRTLGLITFMLPVGIMSASGTLIGNSVGAGRSDHALLYYRTSMKMGVALAFVQVLILLFGKDLFVLLFTN
jgi:MATE family multidrug resistance protein